MPELHTEPSSSQTLSTQESLVSVEVFVSSSGTSGFRKSSRKKHDKHDSSATVGEDAKVKDKSSRRNLARSLLNGNWRPAICKITEEEDRCFLNIYLDETQLYRTISVHFLSHTDVRPVHRSLFLRKDCLSIYCATRQRWSSYPTEPVYIQFSSTDALNTWLALLRSYAIPEVYGRWFFPIEGGSYRMWRQVELSIMKGRNLGNGRLAFDISSNGSAMGEEADASDLDVSCEVLLNNLPCGRTTVKKGIGSPEWHENFTFHDLPPFENLDVVLWRDKRFLKPVLLGAISICLSTFRRCELVEGWYPVLNPGPVDPGVRVGELYLRIRLDEELILPYQAYSELLQTLYSRNILEWMVDFDSKLQLKSMYTHLISIAIAKNDLIEQIFEFADREVDGTPSSHTTLFRGNTTLTKVVELSMMWYGKDFLESSVGSVLRRLCSEKVEIEVDPVRSGKSIKEIEKGVEQLVYWCQEFWKQIYSARNECPNEMRRIFQHIRELVEDRYRVHESTQERTRDLPWQSVSAFCFLRFIVPAILHPHLFGMCPGMPGPAVQRSLTLIAKVIQSLANLKANVQKEEYMRGLQDFTQESLQSMVNYILVVSTPVASAGHNVNAASTHDRLNVSNSLRKRSSVLPVLDCESIPLLPHLLDLPKHLAIVSSAVIRNAQYQHRHPTSPNPADLHVSKLCANCMDVEAHALQRVSQLAAQTSLEHDRHLHHRRRPRSLSRRRRDGPSVSVPGPLENASIQPGPSSAPPIRTTPATPLSSSGGYRGRPRLKSLAAKTEAAVQSDAEVDLLSSSSVRNVDPAHEPPLPTAAYDRSPNDNLRTPERAFVDSPQSPEAGSSGQGSNGRQSPNAPHRRLMLSRRNCPLIPTTTAANGRRASCATCGHADDE